MEIVKGKVTRIFSSNNGFNFFEVDNRVAIKGDLIDLRAGEIIYCEGNIETWEERTYVRAEVLERYKYSTIDVISLILNSALIGDIDSVEVFKLVEELGEQTFYFIERQMGKVKSVTGIPSERINKIQKNWKKISRFKKDIFFLVKCGLSPLEAYKVCSHLRNNISDKIKKDPYLACNILGKNFSYIDDIAISNLSISEHSEVRYRGCINFFTQNECMKTGSTVASCSLVLDKVSSVLSVEAESVNSYMQKFLGKKELFILRSKGKDYLQTKVSHDLDIEIMKNIKRLLNNDHKRVQNFKDSGLRFIHDSKICILDTRLHSSSAINLLKSIIKIFKNNKVETATVCNSALMVKALSQESIEAQTTAHFLGFNPVTQENTINEKNRSSVDVLIVYDGSGVGMSSWGDLLCGISDQTQLIVIYDKYFFTSIEPGDFIADVSKVKSGAVYSGTFRPKPNNAKDAILDYISKKDDRIISSEKSPISIEEPRDSGSLEDVTKRVILARNVASREDQLIAITKTGELSQEFLNDLTRMCLKSKRFGFFPRQKVITNEADYELNLVNGSIGIVNTAGKSFIEVDFDGVIESFERDKFNKLSDAFAITAHKARSHILENTILVLPENLPPFIDTRLIYSVAAITKNQLTIIGNRSNILNVLNKDDSSARITTLSNYLVD